MEKFVALMAMAILVEAVITYGRELASGFKAILLAPIAIGILVAVAYNLDIPAVLGIAARVPFIGNILTGVIIARGSNYLFDTLGKLTLEPSNGTSGISNRIKL